MKKDLILKKVKALQHIFRTGGIEQLHKHEKHPELKKASRENYLYFTLAPVLNFQRSSPALWESAFQTWNDKTTQWLFFPEELIKHTTNEIRQSLLKHKLGLQPNKHTTIWSTIGETLHKFFSDDPRKLLEEGNWSARTIIDLIQNKYRDQFPYLRGPKMANYWLYILHQYTDGLFTDLDAISIIPDTHVQQASVKLGLVSEGATPQRVADAWKSLLENSGIIPIDMHPILWNWSRAGFVPEV